MARTKQEVRNFLNGLVGDRVNAKAGVYSGQCVSLTKALLEFLGVNDPYAARGDAKDAGDAYIRQGIGTAGRGWLTVCVNRDMGLINGVRYGHIWVDLKDEANYEQNGAQALYTTKNTRPVSQAQQFVNLDKWIEEDTVNDDQRKKWARETRRAAYALYLNRGLSISEYKLSDKATDPDKIKSAVAKSAESTKLWKTLAKKYGVTLTDAEIKKHQENYLNMWAAKFFINKVPASAVEFEQITEPVYRKK